jgi:hypothetical protein
VFPYFANTAKAKGHRWFEAHQDSEVHGRFWPILLQKSLSSLYNSKLAVNG